VTVAYDPAVLRAYFEATHTTLEPVTRRPLDAAELLHRAKGTGPLRG